MGPLGFSRQRSRRSHRRALRRLRTETLEDRRLLAAYELTVQVVQVCDDAGTTCAPLGPGGDTSPSAPNEYLYETQVDQIWDQASIDVNYDIVQWNNTAALQISSSEMTSLFHGTWPTGSQPPSPVDGLQLFFTLDHPGTGYSESSPGSGWVANPLPSPLFQARNSGITQIGVMDPVHSTRGRGVMANEGFVSDSLSGTLAHEIGHAIGLRHTNDTAYDTLNDPQTNLAATTPNLMWESGAGPSYNNALTLVENHDLTQPQIDAAIANGLSTSFDPDGNGEGPLKVVLPPGLVVTTADDELDSALPGATLADMGGADDLSLREAIVLANQDPDSDTISFSIPGSGSHVISVTSPLPALSTEITLNATTQAGYSATPVIGIDGSAAGALADGIKITSDNVSVSGLSIYGFDREGIEIVGGDSVTISQNHIGLDLDENVEGNFIGIKIVVSESNTIDSNVISGNERSGIFVNTTATGGNTIVSNKIGTDSTGTSARPNGTDGITAYAPNNTIGAPGQGNLISGNARSAIFLRTAGRGGNTVQSNVIGLDVTGAVALSNRFGIDIRNEGNQVGGSGANEGNVVSGNLGNGISVGTADGTGNTVQGNFVGTDSAGTFAIGNHDGIQIAGAPNNTIGGLGAGEGNVVSGNRQRGFTIYFADSNNNDIVGNTIGTNGDGDTAVPNAKGGVRIVQGAHDNTIRNNQIAGNQNHGVSVDGQTTTANDILFNLIGTDSAGSVALDNGTRGAIRVLSPETTIRGNTITDAVVGVVAFRDATDLVIQQNYIGTDSTGLIDLGIPIGISTSSGVVDAEISENTIANNTTGISNAFGQQVRIENNSIYDNGIGIDLGADGTTANDTDDSDTGANNLQNAPVIASVMLDALGFITISYQIDSSLTSSSYALTVEFFISDDNGQGRTRIAVDQYETVDAQQEKVVTYSAPTVNAGDEIVATVTDSLGNTSEFSVAVIVSEN